MSDPELEPLPPDVRALLDEEARRPEPSAAHVDRLRDRALRELERHPSPMSPRDASPRFSRGPLWFSSGLVVGALLVAALWRRSPARTVVVNQVVVVHVDASLSSRFESDRDAMPNSAELDASPERDARAREPPTRTPTSRSTVSDGSAAAPDLSLRAERELIEIAQSALARRQWSDAIRACEVHLRRFARSELVEEREAIWVQALAGEGRTAEAWARAESFRRRFATSMLRPVVDRAAPPVEPSSTDR